MSSSLRSFESILICGYLALASLAFFVVMDVEDCAVVRSTVDPARVKVKDERLEYAHYWIQFIAGSSHPTWPSLAASAPVAGAESSTPRVPSSPRDYCVAYAFSIWWHFFLNTLAVFGLIYSTYKWFESRRRTMEMAGLLFRRDSELKSEVLNKLLPTDTSEAEAKRQAKLVEDAFSLANKRLYETLVAEVGEKEAKVLYDKFERFLHLHV